MIIDMLLVGGLWLLSIVGMLMSQRKKPVHRANGEQATRVARNTTTK